jgi:uridine kinase
VSSARSRSSRPFSPVAAVDDIVAAASAARGAVRILIDGRSGSGKTTLAREIATRVPGLQTVALDDLYPGWDGLHEGSERALLDVLRPHADGEVGRSRRWDWAESRYGERFVVSPERPLLVEGAGILTPRSAALADIRVWVEAATDERRRRALQRDGATYEPHWDRWARQEDRHLAENVPQTWATHTVLADGAQPAREAARTSPSSR